MKTKKCTICGIIKSVNEFYRDKEKYYRSECKKCHTICSQRILQGYRDQNKNIVKQVRQLGCYFCNEDDIDVLELAHVNEKRYGKGGYLHMTLTMLFKEIEKCEIMCPTCHKKFDLKKIQLRE